MTLFCWHMYKKQARMQTTKCLANIEQRGSNDLFVRCISMVIAEKNTKIPYSNDCFQLQSSLQNSWSARKSLHFKKSKQRWHEFSQNQFSKRKFTVSVKRIRRLIICLNNFIQSKEKSVRDSHTTKNNQSVLNPEPKPKLTTAMKLRGMDLACRQRAFRERGPIRDLMRKRRTNSRRVLFRGGLIEL